MIPCINFTTIGSVNGMAFFKDVPDLSGKQMSNHYEQHMTVPALVAAAFIMPHPQVAFTFLKALFNRPS